MAEIKIHIGGREFEVACRAGEEHFLRSAAGMLDNEAQALKDALGRMPENRMLLMAGLMLADKTASLEDQLKETPVVPPAGVVDPALLGRATKAENLLAQTQAALADVRAKLAAAEAAQATAADNLAQESGLRKSAEAKLATSIEAKAKTDKQIEILQKSFKAAAALMENMVKKIENAAAEK